MYIIIEWVAYPRQASIVQELDGDEASGNAVFDTMEDAEDFAIKNCAFRYQIVKIGGG